MKIEQLLQAHADGFFSLPQYAFPGGYTVVYYDRYGNEFCAECAVKNWYNAIADDDSFYNVDHADVYYEGPAVYCYDCSEMMESSYGDPEEEAVEDEDV